MLNGQIGEIEHEVSSVLPLAPTKLKEALDRASILLGIIVTGTSKSGLKVVSYKRIDINDLDFIATQALNIGKIISLVNNDDFAVFWTDNPNDGFYEISRVVEKESEMQAFFRMKYIGYIDLYNTDLSAIKIYPKEIDWRTK